MREDLLALSHDDLIALSNRGTLKRALREINEQKYTCNIFEEADGTVRIEWDNGETCVMPPDVPLSECECTTPVESKISRHLIRSVLIYQHWIDEQTSKEVLLPPEPWNPGEIPDEAIAPHFTRQKLGKLKQQFKDGLTIELVRSSKPIAHIFEYSSTVRFMVPGNIQYTHSDIDEPDPSDPSSHVPLAIWAFRLLNTEVVSGIVETHQSRPVIPAGLLDKIENTLIDLFELGISGASDKLMGQFQRLIKQCMENGLIWPGDILDALIHEYDRYTSHNARFSPDVAVSLIGELMIRLQYIRNGNSAVPTIFVRGSKHDREAKATKTTLTGLGCAVSIQKDRVTLMVYMQDQSNGIVYAIEKEVSDPDLEDNREPDDFYILGKRRMASQTMIAMGSCQMLVQGGKRTTHYTFQPPRSSRAIEIYESKKLDWENLRAPLLAEDFAEIQARRAARPPASLRPRRAGEDFSVCPITKVEQVHFDPIQQQLIALLLDSTGESATLIHPYTHRGRKGFEKLLSYLTQHPESIRFISGHTRIGNQGLVIHPVGLIFEIDGKRELLQPWIDDYPGPSILENQNLTTTPPRDPLLYYTGRIIELLGTLILTGLQRADYQTIQQWEHLVQEGQSMGFMEFIKPIQAFTEHLALKQHRIEWDWHRAAQLLLNITLLARFARDKIL